MARLRRPLAAGLAGVLALGLLTGAGGAAAATAPTAAPAAADPGAPALEGGSQDLSVQELRLDGVAASAVAELPAADAVPFAEDGGVAASGAAEPGSPTDEPGAAEPGTDAGSPASPEPEAAPTAEPGEAASAGPSAGASTAPTAEPGTTPAPQPSETPGTPAAPEAEPDVLTVEMETDPFSVLGVTWDRTAGLADVEIRYRVRLDGEWTGWQGVEAADVAPDLGTEDAAGTRRDGTDPIVAVGADGVQIWAQAGSGTVTGLKAVLVDPGADPEGTGALVDRGAGTATAAARGASATTGTSSTTGTAGAAVRPLGTATTSEVSTAALSQPGIISRAGWGADESLRTCDADLSTEMVSAAVHHTASANGYSAEAVPGIIRGFYAYHTRPEAAGGRGWCDIGYNFLVDQFGRIFEGRAGGVASTVVGVHTGGFNSRTIGVAAIGNFQTTSPSPALLEALSELIAWKFTVHRILAGVNVQMVSGGGASKYPQGTVVTFPTIYAHRDAQLTSCPGQSLYDALPSIRARVAQLANATVNASPVAELEILSGSTSGVRVKGWAFDPDSGVSLEIGVAVDGAVTRVPAGKSRPDVAAAFNVGPDHGFDATVPAGNGRHQVCVAAANVGAGRDAVLGCAWITVRNATPVGVVDAVSATATEVSVRGWALDPDTSSPIPVHVYVDGAYARQVRADQSRPDIGAAYGKGDAHGFATTIGVTGGSHTVCVYAINTPAGPNPQLGCSTVQAGALPIGALDGVSTTPSSVTVRGWALDPDTRDSIHVHLYVDGAYNRSVRATASRPDVDRAYGLGDAHGFSITADLPQGRHEVCLYLINTPGGPNPRLACRTVDVVNALPTGAIDTARGTATGIRVAGWALDRDTTGPIDVHVYVDGRATRAVTANRNRPDVDRAFGLGAAHGFDVEVPATRGTHQVCLYLINTPSGHNPQLGCRSTTTG